jgi:diacylglycerol kinase family enzyme
VNGVLVVTNELAGRTEADAVEAVLDVLRGAGEVETATCNDEGDVDRILDARRGRRLVVVGGDGSLHTMLGALLRRGEAAECEVALIPLGTGNDFARGVGIPVDDLAAAARIAIGGTAHPTDLIIVADDDDGSSGRRNRRSSGGGSADVVGNRRGSGDDAGGDVAGGPGGGSDGIVSGRGGSDDGGSDVAGGPGGGRGDVAGDSGGGTGGVAGAPGGGKGGVVGGPGGSGDGNGGAVGGRSGGAPGGRSGGGGGVVVNAVHVGAGAQAALRARPLKKRLKIAAFPIGAVLAGFTARGWRLRVTVDGAVVARGRRRVLMAGLSNAPTIAGGTGELAPAADPTDGLADVTVSFAVGPLARVGYALALRRGRHPCRDDVAHLRGRDIRIEGEPFHVNADGELTGPFRSRHWTVAKGAWLLVR